MEARFTGNISQSDFVLRMYKLRLPTLARLIVQKKTWMGHLGNDVIFISAIEKSNIEQLKKLLYSKVREIHIIRFPYNNFLYPEIN